MAYRLLDSRLPRNLLRSAISSKADVGVLQRNLQLQEYEKKTSAAGFIRPHCSFSVTDSDILVAAMGLLEAEASSSQETCQCQGPLREQVATDLPLNNPSSSLMFQPGLPTEQEVTLAVAIDPGVLAIDRGLGADLIEAMENYPNYEQWMAANKQSPNIQLIEALTPLTKQTILSPQSAKRKSYQEWAAKWKRERVLNMSAASRLVTKTDMEPHCRPEYKRPPNRPRTRMPLLPGAVISDDEDDQEEPMTPVKEKIVLTSIEKSTSRRSLRSKSAAAMRRIGAAVRRGVRRVANQFRREA